MLKKFVFTCFFAGVLAQLVLAQDVSITHFNRCPQYINPALTRNYIRANDKYRVYLQSSIKKIKDFSLFNTSMVGYDIKKGIYGFGGYLINKSYAGGVYNYLKGNLSGAYMITPVFSKYKLWTGAHLGLINKHYNRSKLTFENEYDITRARFDPALNDMDNLTSSGVLSIYGSIGAYYRYKDYTEILNPFIGLSVTPVYIHNRLLTTQKSRDFSFSAMLHGGTYLNVSKEINRSKIQVSPRVYYKINYSDKNVIWVGSFLKYKFNRFNSSEEYMQISAGGTYNINTRVLFLQLGFETPRDISYNFSYGFNTSYFYAGSRSFNLIELSVIMKK